MCVGINLVKENNKIIFDNYYCVIVFVFILNLEDDYFKESFDILKLNFESILFIIYFKIWISIYNNGFCKEVFVFLEELNFKNESVD